jgi:uncharacterized protein YqeY
MLLEDKITADYKESMKARDAERIQTISFLRSELKYCAIDKKRDKLEDPDVIGVLRRLIKQRQDSIVGFEKGGRMDLVAKEKAELEVLKAYLPQEMSADDVAKIVDEVAAMTVGATMKDMGRVMKEVLSRARGQADNKLVSDLVRKKLGGG